jgi:hypothetical protein
MVVNEGVKREYSPCSDENVELDDVDAEAKVELSCKVNVEVDVECPAMTGPTICGQAIIILFIRQLSARESPLELNMSGYLVSCSCGGCLRFNR